MATIAASPPASPLASRVSGFERVMIMIGAMMATFMQVLDTTVANVALPHMQTSLGATRETVTWVLTSYIVAAAIAIPITGWLADKVGRKRLFVFTIAAFTIASTLCAMATNLPEMVLFRIIQGLSGALIVPMSQATMLDVNPPEKAARAMTFFGMGTLIGPVLGPVLGGWLTENFNWRWVFLVNIPVGILCIFILLRYLPSSERNERKFDLFGFALLALAVGALQMMLDRGQGLDWFDSWEIWIEIGLVIAAGWMFLVHLFTARDPIFDPKMFQDQNFLATLLLSVVMGLVILSGAALLPPLLQVLMGYSVLDSGLMSAPRGLGSLVAMIIAARTNNRVDPRLMILIGTAIAAYSMWMMSGFDLQMSQRTIVIANFVQGLGMGMTWVPISVLAFSTISFHLRTSAASMLTLFRSVGGSIGISIATTFLARSIQISHSDLAAQITPASTPVIDPSLLSVAGTGGETAILMLDAEINRQAAMIGYINDFHLMMIATIASLPLIFLLKKPPKHEPGESAPIIN